MTASAGTATPVRFAIDMIDPASYTVADGDGETKAARETAIDAGGDQRSAAKRHASVLHALDQGLGRHDFDAYVEQLWHRFYAAAGRSGLPPGRYVRELIFKPRGINARPVTTSKGRVLDTVVPLDILKRSTLTWQRSMAGGGMLGAQTGPQ